MPFGRVEGFFVDSCILLPQSSTSREKGCQDFIKEAGSRCILSSSVKKEAFDLINKAHRTVVLHFQSKLRPYLEEKGIKSISNRDGQIFAEFFARQKMEFKKLPDSKTRTGIQSEIISAIENYVANQLHSIEYGKEYGLDVFLGAISAELSIKKNSLEQPFRGLRSEEIDPINAVKLALVSGSALKNSHDAEHLASAFQYQFLKNMWIVFVTTDQEDILDKTAEFNEMFLLCSRPEWAMDFSRTLTRNKEPLQHIEEIKNPTARQKKVIEVVGELEKLKIQVQTKKDSTDLAVSST